MVWTGDIEWGQYFEYITVKFLSRRGFLLASAAAFTPFPAFSRFPPHGSSVSGALPPDGFTAGIYLQPTVKINPAIATSDPLISGFTRGTGTWTYSVANSGGGSPYLAITIDTTTAATSRFTVKATSALISQSAGTYTATVTADNGVTQYPQVVTITKSVANTNLGMPGGCVFVASSNPAVATASATLKTYANTVWAKNTGDAMLPDNSFATYMRLFGQGTSDTSNQCYIDSVPSATLPWFVVGFFRPENDSNIYGGITYFGCNEDRANKLIMLTTNPSFNPGLGIYQFAWIGAVSFVNNAFGGSSWDIGGNPNGGALNSWQAFCAVYTPNINDNLNFWTDGIFATNQNVGSGWPTAGGVGQPLAMGFGSYGPRTPGYGDNHSYCGAFRNVAAVLGTPNNTDLEAYRTALGGFASASSIWGSNVWATWDFDADPRSTLTIPDTSSQGRPLTIANNSGDAGSPLPWKVTYGVPYVTDSYGPSGKNLFELVSDGAGGYVIKTVVGITPSSYYGTYNNVRLVANGFESRLTLYITDNT